MHARLAPMALRSASQQRTRPIVGGAALGAAAAVGTTTVLFALGSIGTNIQVVTGWAPDGADLRYGEVVVTAALAVVVGAGLLALLSRRHQTALRPWSAIVAVATVLSALPLWRLDVDSSSKLWLTLMHLATGACAVGAQWITHRDAT